MKRNQLKHFLIFLCTGVIFLSGCSSRKTVVRMNQDLSEQTENKREAVQKALDEFEKK